MQNAKEKLAPVIYHRETDTEEMRQKYKAGKIFQQL